MSNENVTFAPPNATIDKLSFSRMGCNGVYSYTVCGKGVDACSGDVTGECYGDIVIPYMYNGYPVVHIDYRGFYDTHITSVNIPASIITIGQEAFSGCVDLTSIIIENGVKEIKDFAFSGGCHNLKSVIIPESIELIQNNAFFRIGTLDTVILKCNKYSYQCNGSYLAETIYNEAFCQNHKLKKIYVIEGKGWNKDDTICGLPIKIIPENKIILTGKFELKKLKF